MDDENTHHNFQDFDESEETLSFCDLSLYADASNCESFSNEFQSSCSSYEEEDFEFSSGEMSNSTFNSSFSAENIVFCGKLIPFGKSVSGEMENENKEKSKKGRSWKWNLGFLKRSKSLKIGGGGGGSNSGRVSRCGSPVSNKKRESLPRKLTAFLPAKLRWYFFVIGFSACPREMKLRDMRRRQSRRRLSASVSRSNGGGGSKNRKSGEDSFWGLIRALGCGGSGYFPANAVVKAA